MFQTFILAPHKWCKAPKGSHLHTTFWYHHTTWCWRFWIAIFYFFCMSTPLPSFHCLSSAEWFLLCLFFFYFCQVLYLTQNVQYNFSVAVYQVDVMLPWSFGSLSWSLIPITKRARPRFCLFSTRGLSNWKRTYFVSGCQPTVVLWLLPSWTQLFKYFLLIHSRWSQES